MKSSIPRPAAAAFLSDIPATPQIKPSTPSAKSQKADTSNTVPLVPVIKAPANEATGGQDTEMKSAASLTDTARQSADESIPESGSKEMPKAKSQGAEEERDGRRDQATKSQPEPARSVRSAAGKDGRAGAGRQTDKGAADGRSNRLTLSLPLEEYAELARHWSAKNIKSIETTGKPITMTDVIKGFIREGLDNSMK